MHDVLIIGAGPAGNMAALDLARAGRSVVVLDSRSVIGDKLCTGIIGNECAALLPPRQDIIHTQANSATVVSPAGRRYRIRRSKPHAYILNRVAYVNSVAEQAQEHGAAYHLNTRANRIRTTTDSVKVTATSPGGETVHSARIAIIAAGFGTPLVRQAGLHDAGAGEYLVGCQAEVETRDIAETEVYLGSAHIPGSFAWIAPTAEGRALVGMVPRKSANSLIDAFIAKLQAGNRIGSVIGKPRTWGIPVRPLSRTYTDRILVVGDAAGLVKPTTGGGIYYAFLSGRIAADKAHTAIANGSFTARQLRAYQSSWQSVFARDLRISYYARMLYETLNDEQIEHLMEEFLSERMLTELLGNDIAFDWHGKIIARALRRADILRALRTLGPAAAPFAARLLRLRN